MAYDESHKKPRRGRRTLGLIVASTVATAPVLGCGSDAPSKDMADAAAMDTATSTDTGTATDTGASTETPLAMDTAAPTDATKMDGTDDADDAYPSGVRG